MAKNKATNGTSLGKIILGSALGFFIFYSVLGILWLIMVLVMASASMKQQKVDTESVLQIKLDYPIVEQQQDDFTFNLNLLSGYKMQKKVGLNKILQAIKTAKDDDNIKGIFLDLSTIQASMATVDEIRNALEDFKQSGKFIIAHSDFYTPKTYFLASVADKVYMTPTGTMLWKGMAAQVMYYKQLLEKIGVQPEIIRHGKYKSAVEPFMLDSMSNENREQLQVLLNSLWNRFTNQISEDRHIEVSALNNYADKLLINSDSKSVSFGLIDALKYRNDVIDEMKELMNIDLDNKLHSVSLYKYIEMHKNTDFKTEKDKIAVIYASGQIIPGESKDEKMGGNTIARAIRKAADDENVKAIVFRVNSPGGSALASDVIWAEIIRAKKMKPVVVSMGDYAASGGYYISCAADKIFADPYTITGSIGVFGMLFNAHDLIYNKLGIKVEVVETNKNSDFGNFSRALTPDERNFYQMQIEQIYGTFVNHVANGRDLDSLFVDSIAQGRVWSADDALKIGLVDSIGRINDAVEYAAKLAGVTKYSIKEYPKVKPWFEQFIDEFQTSMAVKKYGILYKTYQEINNLQYLEGIQAIMPYKLDIE